MMNLLRQIVSVLQRELTVTLRQLKVTGKFVSQLLTPPESALFSKFMGYRKTLCRRASLQGFMMHHHFLHRDISS